MADDNPRLDLPYLLEEVIVDTPDEREDYMQFNKLTEETCDWPKDFWAVSEEDNAYIAFFRFDTDAYAFRLMLINMRQNGGDISARYNARKPAPAADEGYDAEDEDGPVDG